MDWQNKEADGRNKDADGEGRKKGKREGKCLERVGGMLYLCAVNGAISRSEAFFDNLRPLKK